MGGIEAEGIKGPSRCDTSLSASRKNLNELKDIGVLEEWLSDDIDYNQQETEGRTSRGISRRQKTNGTTTM